MIYNLLSSDNLTIGIFLEVVKYFLELRGAGRQTVIIWQKIIRKYSNPLYTYLFILSRGKSPTIMPNRIMNIISIKLLY